MSRYLILVILNLPFIIYGIFNAIVSYKLRQSSKNRLVFRLALWLAILAGLILVEPLYNYLFSNNLTQTESLSLFDVIQITGVVIVLLLANRANTKAVNNEKRFNELHKEISIRIADISSKE